MLGKSPIKWKQRPDMTIAVDWDVKSIQTKMLAIYTAKENHDQELVQSEPTPIIKPDPGWTQILQIILISMRIFRNIRKLLLIEIHFLLKGSKLQ